MDFLSIILISVSRSWWSHCEHWTHSTNTVIIGYNYYWKFEDDKWYKLYGYCPNNNNIVSNIKRPALRGSWTIGSLDFLHVVSSIWRYFHNVPSKVFSTTWQHGSCTHNLNHCCDKATKMQAKERQEGQGVKMECKKKRYWCIFRPHPLIFHSFNLSVSRWKIVQRVEQISLKIIHYASKCTQICANFCFICIFGVCENVCICQFEKHLRRLQVNFTPPINLCN